MGAPGGDEHGAASSRSGEAVRRARAPFTDLWLVHAGVRIFAARRERSGEGPVHVEPVPGDHRAAAAGAKSHLAEAGARAGLVTAPDQGDLHGKAELRIQIAELKVA